MHTSDNIRVLVIDDDELTREFLCEVLRFEGFTVFDLPTTTAVRDTILREAIRVLVVDIMMPELRGDQLAERLRQDSELGELAVVLVSGCERAELQKLKVDLSAHTIINKAEVRKRLAHTVLDAAHR